MDKKCHVKKCQPCNYSIRIPFNATDDAFVKQIYDILKNELETNNNTAVCEQLKKNVNLFKLEGNEELFSMPCKDAKDAIKSLGLSTSTGLFRYKNMFDAAQKEFVSKCIDMSCENNKINKQKFFNLMDTFVDGFCSKQT